MLQSYRNIFFLIVILSLIALLMNEYFFGNLPEFNLKVLHNRFQNSSSWEVIRALLRKDLIRLPDLTLPSPDPSFTSISKVSLGLSYKDVNETVRTYYKKRVQPPGIVLQWKGGIGNQLFQYACHYALAKDLGFPLYIWISRVGLESFKSERSFLLDKLKIPIDNIVDNSTRLDKLSHISDQDLMENLFLFRFRNDLNTRFITLDGISYCQSIEYWVDYQEDIRSMFEPREEVYKLFKLDAILKKIRESESVAVHVRRGDFVRTDIVVPISFQRRAIWKMAKLLEENYKVKPVFFIFSDDITYAIEKLKDFEQYYELVYVSLLVGNDEPTTLEEFYLMSQSKHNIFASSTFGWWAGFLNRNKRKIVITSTFADGYFKYLEELKSPARHFWKRQFSTLHIPKDWIVLNPYTGGLEVDK